MQLDRQIDKWVDIFQIDIWQILRQIDRYLTGWVNVCIDILNRQIKREIDRQIDRYTIYDIYIDHVDRYTRIFMQIMQGIYVDYVDRYTRIFMQIMQIDILGYL